MNTTPLKFVKKVKLGEPVPASATLLKIEKENVKLEDGDRDPRGGDHRTHKEVEFCYYEVTIL